MTSYLFADWTGVAVFFALVAALLSIKHYLVNTVLFARYFSRKEHKRFWFRPLLIQSTLSAVLATGVFAFFYGQTGIVLGLIDGLLYLLFNVTLMRRRQRYNVFDQRFWYLADAEELLIRLSTLALILGGLFFNLSNA